MEAEEPTREITKPTATTNTTMTAILEADTVTEATTEAEEEMITLDMEVT